MDAGAKLWTITDLAKRSGVSSRTIRFWSDEGLIPVARRSAARYRLYDDRALSRLELVRTLRELGIGLSAITSILKRQQTLAQVAAAHVAALDARIRDLRVQRAVLRALVRRGENPGETKAMQKLVHTSAAERKRLVDTFVTRVFENIAPDAPGAHIAHAMCSLPPQLPENPSDAHLEAWIELAQLLDDPTFAARVREMAVAGAAATAQQSIDIPAIRQHATAALDAGVAPDSPAATELLDRILPGSSADERTRLRETLETFNDERVERYWQLMGTLNDRPPFPPAARAIGWFITVLRAHER